MYSEAISRSASSVHRHLAALQPGLGQLPGQQVVPGDEHLLVLGVAVELDQLHPVEQRARDAFEHVRGGQEHHVGQVEVHLQVVVAEGVVLRRVEHLQQRRRGVAAVVGADLVHLVEQHDWVHRARLADGPDDPAGQRADIGAAVPTDFCLIADPAERDPDELAAHRPGHRLAQRGLADAGRPDQGEHGAAAAAADDAEAPVRAALAHRQVLDDPLLHVVEPGVVLIEDPPRPGDVVGVLGPLVPRHFQDGVQPGADRPGLRRRVGGPLQPTDLLQRGLAHVLRQVGRFDPGPVVVFLAVTVAGQLAEFLAHRGELLAEQVLLLLLLHALGDVLADGLGHVQLGQVVAGPADRQLQPLRHIGGLQQGELLLGGQVRGVAGPVGDHRRVVELFEGIDHLPQAALAEHADDQGLVLLGQLRGAAAQAGLLDHSALDPQRRAGPGRARADPDTGHATHHRARLTARQPANLLDNGQRADARQAALGQPGHQQHLCLAFGMDAGHLARALIASGVDGAADLGVGQLDRHHHARQHHLVVQWQHRQGERLAHVPSKC